MNKLYIVMRNDVDSMNPGKAMAQAAHAGQMFEKLSGGKYNEDCGFITTLVLQGSGEDINDLVYFAEKSSFLWGEVVDPTYPVRDGSVTHLLPFRTCVWILIPDDKEISSKEDKNLNLMLSTYPLHY